ncbi:hypothetical protein GCM10009840_17470 [Pseudolysinimonas kribbensis]|uniref:PDZ domain-containing protein n=1 Tax=Pseudolysinimonas kribbensis TaxID=433641 RepID=A0ABQ6K2T6_9MICO|nr:trypsin-like peptidase domain-containing protein [Pseudolysinimonas kribbensis]GMA93873.1 hypothetical protein GCM10025881_06970 [Pseudolysinimonas kribbensis]
MSDPTQHSDETPADGQDPTPSTPSGAVPAPDATPASEAMTTQGAPADSATDSPATETPAAETPAAETEVIPDATPSPSTYRGSAAPEPAYQPTAAYPTAPVAGGPTAGASGGPGAPAVATAPGTVGAPTTADKKRSIAIPVVIALIAGAIVGGGSAAGVSALIDHNGPSQQQSTSGDPQTITINNSGDVNAVTAIAKKAGPSVVTINVTAGDEAGTGSGVVLSDDGYVLTNTHVVTLDGDSGSGKVEVTTYDGKLYKAKVIGTDPIVDLAVIKLQNATGLTPIEWGDSSRLNVGDRVVAIGAPLGLSNTVTDGIVSALNRSIQIESSAAPDTGNGDKSSPNDNGGTGPFNFWNFGNGGNGNATPSTQSAEISLPVIQTDAAINPGNSGGALVDSSGKLVGINVAIASTGSTSTSGQTGSIGVGFAIPASLAQRIASEIEKTGKGTHGLLGASVTDATADKSSTVGALIVSVTDGGAAAAAGLQKGDVVTQLNGIPITSSSDLTAQVRALAPKTKATVTYQRDDSSHTVDVTLGTLTAS